MIYIGIDPGKSGAIAIMNVIENINAYLNVFQYKVFVKDLNSELIFIKNRIMNEESKCVIEKVHSWQGQGVKSTFTFGENYGWWKGILDTLGISYKEVTPQAWKGWYRKYYTHINSKWRLLNTKEDSVELAEYLFPSLEKEIGKNHNRAEALLLMNYCKEIRNTWNIL